MAGTNNLISEIWISAIQENLFEPNDFWTRAQDHSEWVNNGIVHVPNAGVTPTVILNPSVYPLPVSQRVDNSLDYPINNYAIAPWFVPDVELIQIRYDKVKSLMYALSMQLKETLASTVPYLWSSNVSTSRKVFTSGSTSALMLPSYAGSIATGTRKLPTLADIAAIKTLMDDDFLPQEGRCMLFPAVMWNNGVLQLSNIIINQYYDNSVPVVPTGKNVPIFNMETFTRPNVLYTDNSGNILTYNASTGLPATPGTTDCCAAIAWHPSMVTKAMEGIEIYYEPKRPEYQGDLMSARLLFGSSYLRTDGRGVYLLIAAA